MGLFSGISKMLFGEAPKPNPNAYKFAGLDIDSITGGVDYDKGAGQYTLTLAPELESLYKNFLTGAESALPSMNPAQTKFATDIQSYGQGLFADATNKNLDQYISDYYNRGLKMLQPERTMEDIRMQEDLYRTGQGGLGINIGGEGYINPQVYSKDLAREMANIKLRQEAEDVGRGYLFDELSKGIGYAGLGQEMLYQPYNQAANIMNYGLPLTQLNNPLLGYSIQGGAPNTQGQIGYQNALQNQYSSNMGFWGNLLGSGATAAATYFRPTTIV